MCITRKKCGGIKRDFQNEGIYYIENVKSFLKWLRLSRIRFIEEPKKKQISATDIFFTWYTRRNILLDAVNGSRFSSRVTSATSEQTVCISFTTSLVSFVKVKLKHEWFINLSWAMIHGCLPGTDAVKVHRCEREKWHFSKCIP